MKQINFDNVEKIIFQDPNIKNILPSYYWNYFEQWKLAKQVPMLKQLGKTAILDFLNHITDEDIKKLEDYFEERILVHKLNYNIVLDMKIPLNEIEICEKLKQVIDFTYFNTWRDDSYLYIVFWR